MKYVLIYPKKEIERNKFAISIYEKELGAALEDVNYDGDCDCVINRTNDYKIAEKFEKKGIRVFNPSTLSKLANDKQLCYDFMQENGIDIMPTRYSTAPFVKKPLDGHGGEGVVLCTSQIDYDKTMVCQKMCDTPGRDLRVYILNGQIITAYLRKSDADFRSNYCLGGTCEKHNLNNQESELISRICTLVKGDFFGIDLIYNNGKAVFNEIEDTVGARMVYDNENIDIISMYCQYIKKEMEENG